MNCAYVFIVRVAVILAAVTLGCAPKQLDHEFKPKIQEFHDTVASALVPGAIVDEALDRLGVQYVMHVMEILDRHCYLCRTSDTSNPLIQLCYRFEDDEFRIVTWKLLTTDESALQCSYPIDCEGGWWCPFDEKWRTQLRQQLTDYRNSIDSDEQ